MQPLTGPPRDGFDADEVRDLLTADGVQRGFGCDALVDGQWVDVSEYVHAPWTVSHDNTAEVHGSLSIELTRAFAWGTTWFRPWATLALPGRVWLSREVVDTVPVMKRLALPTEPSIAGWPGTLTGALDVTADNGYLRLPYNGGQPTSGVWTSEPVDLTGIVYADGPAYVFFHSTDDADGDALDLTVEASLDGGTTWTSIPETGTPLPGVSGGTNLAGRTMVFRASLSSDGQENCYLTSFSCEVFQGPSHAEYRTVPAAARFDCGVYLLSTPTRTYGRDPAVYQCSGKDLLTLATRQVGDTFAVAKGSSYLDTLRGIFRDRLGMSAPLLDGSAADAVLPDDRVWALAANPRWLDVANDLLAEVGYVDVYMSPDGVPRSHPVAPDDDRPVEWEFATDQPLTDLIAAEYEKTLDLWAAPNRWRFVRNGLAYQPSEGDGVYTVTNQSDGPASVDSVGLNPAETQWLDVADQAALVAEGDRVVAADRRAEAAYEIDVDPLPIAWHRDMVRLTGGGESVRLQVTSWELSPVGKGRWMLGGGPGGEPAEPVSVSATGTVTQASADGLRVVVDGATVDSAATALADENGTVPSYTVGQRVQVTVRNPAPPQVQGVVADDSGA